MRHDHTTSPVGGERFQEEVPRSCIEVVGGFVQKENFWSFSKGCADLPALPLARGQCCPPIEIGRLEAQGGSQANCIADPRRGEPGDRLGEVVDALGTEHGVQSRGLDGHRPCIG